MEKNMKVWLLTAEKKLEMGTRPVPRPAPGEVLIRVRAVGVCGSDVHYYEHGRIGDYVVKYPFVLGHETAGEVAALGDGVDGLSVGDRVALEPGATCGRCEYCLEGRYNLCADVRFFATPPYDGTFAEFVTHPAHLCFPISENVSFAEGALIEPLAVGFHAASQAHARPGKTALVLGGGCIGLVTALALRAFGCALVIVSEPVEIRREKASSMGFDVINPLETDVGEVVCAMTDGGAHIVVETAGSAAATLQSVSALRRGGVIVLVGLTPDPVQPFDIGGLINREAEIKTVFRYRNLYPAAISAVAGGLDIASIVTNRYGFDSVPEALENAACNKQAVVKAVVEL